MADFHCSFTGILDLILSELTNSEASQNDWIMRFSANVRISDSDEPWKLQTRSQSLQSKACDELACFDLVI